ncbi:CREB-regulated transcription coactivator 2 [Gastrophryne carolinensis]
MAASPGSSAPRKFSEKIALQKQRQAEETAAFVQVMADLSSARVQVQKVRMAHMKGSYYGGSLPNVNQITSAPNDFLGSPQSPVDSTRSTRHHGLVERVSRDPRRMMSPLRRLMRHMDSSPYSVSHLSPHQEANWRRNLAWGGPSDAAQLFRLPSALNRTNSDSALHTSVMNPGTQEPYPPASQGVPTLSRKNAFAFPALGVEEAHMDSGHLLKPYDAKKLSSASGRPKSCEVPGINIYPSADLPPSGPPMASILNSGGSLPDLTSLHFPSPLPTPLDPEESGFCSLSGGSSTGNLASTMTHLGISRGGGGLPHMLDSSGFSPPSGRHSLQSSLSNPNLQASLNSASLQTSYSNPALAGAPLQSSLSNPNLQAALGGASLQTMMSNASSLSSLSPSASAYSTPTSPSTSSFPPSSLSTSPRRRVPLSPLTLSMAGDGRRGHQKQYSPTMSPTLTSIAQGIPLDTSKMSTDPRLPPYHFSHPSLLHQSPQQMPLSQQPMHQSPQSMVNSQQNHQMAPDSHQNHQMGPNSQQNHQMGPNSQQNHQMGPDSHQNHQMGPNSQQNHQMGPNSQQNHQMGPNSQQNHQMVPNSQQNHQMAPNSQQNHQMSPNSQQNHQMAPNSQQNHQMGPNSQQDHQMGPNSQQNHQMGPNSQQNHQMLPNSQQNPQVLHNSQQPLHPSPQHMPQSRQQMIQSQIPFQQSQNALSQQQPMTSNQPTMHSPNQTLNHHPAPETSQKPLQQIPYKDFPGVQNFYPPYQHFLGDYQLGSSLLSSLFDECDLQLSTQRTGALSQQCNMAESRRLGLTPYSYSGDYQHMNSAGLTGPFNPPSFRKQNSSNSSRHDPIPNIILTAVDSPPGFSKEITSALSCVPGFEMDTSLGLDEDLNIEPLTVDGLNMLSDPYAPLTDPLVEDSFRSDRLQ